MNFSSFSITNLFILSFKTTGIRKEKTMTINLPSFKGYDAAPLKHIYMERTYCRPFEWEMYDVCEAEKINPRTIYNGYMWAQDDKCILEKDGKPFMLAQGDISKSFLQDMKQKFGIAAISDYAHLTGGNTFIGKFPNGEKWLITGEEFDEYEQRQISRCYNIPANNIHHIPKPDFHIDMGIRPIGFPDILVNDPEIAEKNLEKLDDGSKEYNIFKQTFDAYKEGYTRTYASTDEICNALKKIGFNPIRVGGVYYNGINFMNAIVNKHPDGTMGYITNASKCQNPVFTKLQKVFEDEIREKVPTITNFYFLEGTHANPRLVENSYMIDSIKHHNGGIHCMTMEEPDFEKWA